MHRSGPKSFPSKPNGKFIFCWFCMFRFPIITSANSSSSSPAGVPGTDVCGEKVWFCCIDCVLKVGVLTDETVGLF